MGSIAESFVSTFRDYVTQGVPATGAHRVEKADARSLGQLIELALSNVTLAGMLDVVKDTRAHLDADLAHPADSVAIVYADATNANNDLYFKVGSSGTGSWTLTTILHDIIAAAAAPALAQADADADRAEAAAALIPNVVGLGTSDVTTVTYGVTTAATITVGTTNGYGNDTPQQFRGQPDFDIRVSASGTGYFIALPTYGPCVISSLVNVVSGVQTITRPFGGKIFDIGTRYSYLRVTGGYLYYEAATASEQIANFVNGDEADGYVSEIFVPSFRVSMATVITYSPAEHETFIRNGGKVAKPVVLANDTFAGTGNPAGWTFATTKTVNNGLTLTGTPGWANIAYGSKVSQIRRRQITTRFIAPDATASFGLLARDIQSAGPSGGAVIVDGSAGTLNIYGYTTGTGTLRASKALAASLVANRPYTLTIRINDLFFTATLTDTLTGAATVLTYIIQVGISTVAKFNGAHGVIWLSGTTCPTFDYIRTEALHSNDVTAIVVGDSNTECLAFDIIRLGCFYQLGTLLGRSKVVISARAGNVTSDAILCSAQDISLFTAKYVFIALGTNDSSQATWRTNMATLIATIAATGAEPILVCLMPKAAATVLGQAMNDDIRGYYFGKYRYVDFAKAISTGHDGVTWDALYNSGDSIHDNSHGQIVRFGQILRDLPDIQEGVA